MGHAQELFGVDARGQPAGGKWPVSEVSLVSLVDGHRGMGEFRSYTAKNL